MSQISVISSCLIFKNLKYCTPTASQVLQRQILPPGTVDIIKLWSEFLPKYIFFIVQFRLYLLYKSNACFSFIVTCDSTLALSLIYDGQFVLYLIFSSEKNTLKIYKKWPVKYFGHSIVHLLRFFRLHLVVETLLTMRRKWTL